MNAIQAAFLEIEGQGSFALKGRKVIFTGKDGLTREWSCRDAHQAAEHMSFFRRSPRNLTREQAFTK
jgi:hypothetical protein